MSQAVADNANDSEFVLVISVADLSETSERSYHGGMRCNQAATDDHHEGKSKQRQHSATITPAVVMLVHSALAGRTLPWHDDVLPGGVGATTNVVLDKRQPKGPRHRVLVLVLRCRSKAVLMISCAAIPNSHAKAMFHDFTVAAADCDAPSNRCIGAISLAALLMHCAMQT